ncbi:MAG: amylosucrase [Chloroflexi bacterium RBG_16_54_18]|nr:MAG: amylosucrase [Chloroflexi bacterium RBG_16_54_18]
MLASEKKTEKEGEWVGRQAEKTLQRLAPRLQQRFSGYIQTKPAEWQPYWGRLQGNFHTLFSLLYDLYGEQYDFFFHLESLLERMTQSWIERSKELKTLDSQRLAEPAWYLSNRMLGGVCYVDRFAGDLAGIKTKIPYFKELGLSYLHLMPLFRMPEKENDGGYAISDYRDVHPPLGEFSQLVELADALRREGISLVLDFVFNHTSDEHRWAKQALSGDPDYQAYYRMFPDRSMPDAYEKTLREIFPEEHPGAFTYVNELRQWVWTTFHSYQWDLNYGNPLVFNEMAGEMLYLANQGVEVLRLDALAFTWKEMGTSCENLPKAHTLIQAFNCLRSIAAPALLFKSEAIVHPDEVVKYISLQECQLSYNPLLMALLWNTLATRQVNLLNQALRERSQLPPGTAWVNYVRCHDDIGWTFSDEDALNLDIDGNAHRRFLNEFYTGRFPGSFARGLPFQENLKTGDMRISGTTASLAGLEKALAEETPVEVELAVRRILLIHAVILAVNGIPLLYLGDESGVLNDYSFNRDPQRAGDSRWVHRPILDWDKMAMRSDSQTIEGRVFEGLKRLIGLRMENPAFSGDGLDVMVTGNDHLLGFVRQGAGQRLLLLANFSETEQALAANQLRLYGLGYTFRDLLNEAEVPYGDLKLPPYAFACLECRTA